jgi:hypothetical protein
MGMLWESMGITEENELFMNLPNCWNVIYWDTVEICWNADWDPYRWMDVVLHKLIGSFQPREMCHPWIAMRTITGSVRAHAIPLRWSRPKWFHHPLQCPSRPTEQNKGRKWHEMTWNDMKWLVSKSNGRMECSYFKGSESHRITWLSWFIPVSRVCRIYLSVPADFQSLGFDLLKICTVRSWQK